MNFVLSLILKTEEHERKKYLMVDDYMLNKVLDKIKILIDADDKLPDITLKNVVILMTCVIKDGNKFHS